MQSRKPGRNQTTNNDAQIVHSRAATTLISNEHYSQEKETNNKVSDPETTRQDLQLNLHHESITLGISFKHPYFSKKVSYWQTKLLTLSSTLQGVLFPCFSGSYTYISPRIFIISCPVMMRSSTYRPVRLQPSLYEPSQIDLNLLLLRPLHF